MTFKPPISLWTSLDTFTKLVISAKFSQWLATIKFLTVLLLTQTTGNFKSIKNKNVKAIWMLKNNLMAFCKSATWINFILIMEVLGSPLFSLSFIMVLR